MEDYINRNRLINGLNDWALQESPLASRQSHTAEYSEYDMCQRVYRTIRDAIRAVKEQPSEDVQPVRHGRFVGISYDGYADGNPVFYEWKCSECGKIVVADDANELNYCCNCGARMDGEQNGTN